MFSGVNCPGLIEAVPTSADSLKEPPSSFPGLIAPASLKRDAAVQNEAAEPRGGFPGLIAPASLKQSLHRSEHHSPVAPEVFRG